jgi:hypothetical protein
VALDDRTVPDSRAADVIPGPRAAEPSGDIPWTQPRGIARSTRPLSEYWHHDTANWTPRSSVPVPRPGD